MTDETTPEGAAAPAEEAKPEVKEADTKEVDTKAENTEKQADSETTEETTDESKPKGKGFQKRINQLTRNVRELERALEAERSARQTTSHVEVKGEPQLSEYEDWGKYAKDVAKWEVERAKGEFSRKSAEEINRVLVQKAQDDFRERLDSFSDKHDDFSELVEEIAPMIRGASLDSLIESKYGPEIIYHLAKNPEEAERISKMSPNAAAREIGRIEERLSTKQVKRTTSAPAPSKTIAGGTSTSTPLEKMEMKDFIKARRAQLNNT